MILPMPMEPTPGRALGRLSTVSANHVWALGMRSKIPGLTLFNKTSSNPNRVQGGSVGGMRGRSLPESWSEKLNADLLFRREFCRKIHHSEGDFLKAVPASRIPQSHNYDGNARAGKVSFSVFWKDGKRTNFRTRTGSFGQIHLEVPNSFISNFTKRFGTAIPQKVQDALLLFTGCHPDTEQIWASLPERRSTPDARQSEVLPNAAQVRSLESQYFHRLVLSSIFLHDPKTATAFVEWLAKETPRLFEYCFIRGGFPSKTDSVDWLLFPDKLDELAGCTFIDLQALSRKVERLSLKELESLVSPGDKGRIGSTIDLPFGNLQYHERCLQFRFDKRKLESLGRHRTSTFGSRQKNRGHLNERLVEEALRKNGAFLNSLQYKIRKEGLQARSIEVGGIRAKHVPSATVVNGRHSTPAKTDIAIQWSDGSRTNFSLKLKDGQVDHRKVDGFCAGFKAQFGNPVPTDVHRALSLFFGSAHDSIQVFNSISPSVVDQRTWEHARHQNHRLVYNMLYAYQPQLAKGMLKWLADEMECICRFCFSCGLVRAREDWADYLWHRNLVDPALSGFDYLVSIEELCVASKRAAQEGNGVAPGPKNGGSSIHLPFGHLEYLHGGMEFYQSISKIQRILS